MNVVLKCVVLLAFVAYAAADYPECPYPEVPGGSYFPDPDDCRYFYQCANGEAIQVMCAPGTIYNDSIKNCDYATDLSCIPS